MRISLFIYLLAAIGLVQCNTKTSNEFTIKGSVKNSLFKVVYLEEAALESAQPVVVDSATVDKNGRFTLSVIAKEENLYLLRADTDMNPFATVINDAPTVNITVDPTNPVAPYTATGSAATNQLRNYFTTSNKKLSAVYALGVAADSLQQTGVADSVLATAVSRRNTAAAAFKQYVLQEVKNARAASLAVFILGSYQSYAANPRLGLPAMDRPEMTEQVKSIVDRFPKHSGVAALQQSLTAAPASPPATSPAAFSFVNQPAPDFTLPDTGGKPVSLSSFKGKWVLVDFWASWCGPCRAENPNVVAAFKQFNMKNFTILGVSLDKAKEPWQKAIVADGLTWTHVSDLQFWNSAVVPLYRIEGIPFNVLVDPAGKVVAENLRGEGLIQKLQEVL